MKMKITLHEKVAQAFRIKGLPIGKEMIVPDMDNIQISEAERKVYSPVSHVIMEMKDIPSSISEDPRFLIEELNRKSPSKTTSKEE